jgi:signal transduction histidine kinase
MPRLASRYFSSASAEAYDIAVASSKNLIYRSSESWDARSGDVSIDIRPLERSPGKIVPASAVWTLRVRHRGGGLESLVEGTRRRNLAISFGVLAILGLTVILLILLLRRTDRLRVQQAEFVAAITHELNTPVAALRSAGQNLRDGIVSDRDKVARYGDTIVRESARLGEMIGEVLELSGMRARSPRTFEPLDLRAIIDEAVAQSITAERVTMTVDVTVDPDLPPVKGDAQLLTRAVQNLVANAIRHGGAGQWVGVRASRDGDKVRITVEDRGRGIDSADAPHLFEPFYRGRASRNVRGTGLGLAIVKHIVADHGGSIVVERRSAGAAFTIHLPVAVSA